MKSKSVFLFVALLMVIRLTGQVSENPVIKTILSGYT